MIDMVDYKGSIHSKLRRGAFGFSVIEMMVTIVLISVAAALALPSYNVMIEKRHLATGAEQLAAFIGLHQGEAVRRSQVITISYHWSDIDRWCVGAVLGEAACDCTQTATDALDYCAIDSGRRVMDSSEMTEGDLVLAVSGDGSFAFDPAGDALVDAGDALTMEMRSGTHEYQLNLEVTDSGTVDICSRNAEHLVPGYDLCRSLTSNPPDVEGGPD